eukprot:CAMPEP_0176423562 /NCGR_PEP_ID=MMETSP0127-20121128/10352_1 /TAXON_ID=938130 /ORGANISM="Platyophrya macrostoma, Strain WH" /LENGTH=360 /DNA_ID=CAMNT_0017804525 /DNA_START=16 /DNA_END=1095 /DNA_ORIENTATION=-
MSNHNRHELELQLLALQERNRKLHSEVQLQESRNSELKRKLRTVAAATDMEEEQISNGLLKRLDSMNRERDSLARLLLEEERRKAEQEAAWRQLQRNRASLEAHLRSEDVEMREKLERQLAFVQRSRQALENQVKDESETLQQLQECIRSFRESSTSTPTCNTNPPIETEFTLRAGNSTPRCKDTTSRSLSTASVTATPPLSACSNTQPAPSLPVPLSSPSLTPSSSMTTAPLPAVVSTPRDSGMLRILEAEIKKAEDLHHETVERLVGYQTRIAELQDQVAQAEAERDVQRRSVETLQHELRETVSEVREINANQLVLSEWMIDQKLLGSHGTVRSSSACSSNVTAETTTSDWQERMTP